jgi:septal ring factor EnvC (AmiA/AmiB activator)
MIKILGTMGVVIAVMAGIFYWYYQSSQTTIANLYQERGTLVAAVETQSQAIEFLEENISRVNQQLNITNQELTESRQQNRQLVDRLGRHEISVLARARPRLVERTINNATEQTNRCFELLSGAEMNERERNATTAREFNSECPWLFDTLRLR